MATIQTSRGLLTANSASEVQSLVNAGLITGAEATQLLGDIGDEAPGPRRGGPDRAARDRRLTGPVEVDAVAGPARAATPSRVPQPTQAAVAPDEFDFVREALSRLRAGAQAAGPVAAAGPTGTPQEISDADLATLGESGRTAFLRRRGVGTDQIPLGSRAAQFIGSQFGPLQELFRLQQTVNAASGTTGGASTIGGFTGQFPDLASRAQRGSTILSDFFNLTPTQRRDFGLNFDPAFDEEGNAISGGQDLSFLQSLLRQGTRSTRGPQGANILASRLPFVQQRFQLEAPGGDFVDFARQRLGLAGF